MIVCQQFVFVHMPKTGGTWVRDTLKHYRHPLWHLQERFGHHPARTGPTDRPVLGIVRNPWDWYVSSYFFRRNNIQRGLGAWSKPRAQWLPGMREWEAVMKQLPDGAEGFREALPIMTRFRGGVIKTERYEELPAEDGCLSWRHDEFFRDADGRMLCDVVRFESLREEIRGFLLRHNIPVKRNLLTALRTAPKKNAAPRGEYRDYYDSESRDLVAEADRAIIEQYGYEF